MVSTYNQIIKYIWYHHWLVAFTFWIYLTYLDASDVCTYCKVNTLYILFNMYVEPPLKMFTIWATVPDCFYQCLSILINIKKKTIDKTHHLAFIKITDVTFCYIFLCVLCSWSLVRVLDNLTTYHFLFNIVYNNKFIIL